MSNQIHINSDRRHDFVILFDVQDGNPNGDPDNDNLPRTDPETGQGIVTDVCLKRKVRDYVTVIKGGSDRFRIYVQKADVALNTKHAEAYKALDLKESKKKPNFDAQKWMCQNFYDIRCFGAVMSTGDHNCGQVRGPLQMTFARSFDRVFSHDITITRVGITTEKDREIKETEMGRKALVPYGLYMGHGFFNPMLAKGTGLSDEDLALFWEALENMFELDRSASRGLMALRGLYIFSHERPTGNAPAHKLFEGVAVKLKEDISVPRRFDDYDVTVDKSVIPDGVTLTQLVG